MKKVWIFGVLLALCTVMQPAMAWGLLSHTQISMDAGNPYPSYTTEYRSGAIGPDSGWFSPLSDWGDEYHGEDVATANEIGSEMLDLAASDRQRAFAEGWWGHVSQDRPAHGNGQGYPDDGSYGIGYINYEAQQTGQDHTYVEFEVDGRVYYEKGFGGLVYTYSIPTGLIYDTMEAVYGDAPSTGDILDAYSEVAKVYYADAAFWGSPAGSSYYSGLWLTGRHSNYDDYVGAVNCNPYYEAIQLTNNPYSGLSVLSAKANGISQVSITANNNVDGSVLDMANNSTGDVKKHFNYWMLEYAERLEKSGAIKVKTYSDEEGWDMIKIETVDRQEANEIAEEILREMVKDGVAPKDALGNMG